MQVMQTLVEFVGGPFDGHQQMLRVPRMELAETVALPVNENVFRMLNRKKPGPTRPSRTVAFYELGSAEAGRYYYLGSRLTSELSLQNWDV